MFYYLTMTGTLGFILAIDQGLYRVYDSFLIIAPYLVYILPFLFGYALWKSYLYYIRALYIKKTDWLLLEVKIPKEISKSPAAMELLDHVFYQTYEGELVDRFIRGSSRSWFSLEIASFGGDVHFYLRIPKFFKDLVEAQVYSQYPEVEIFEVDDYTKNVNYDQPGSPYDIWGWEWKFTKADAYPIKTYVDYGMGKDPKEEFKIDPMTPLLEFLGSIKQTEQIWFQILVMASKERFPVKRELLKPSSWFKMQDWKKDAQAELDKVLKRKEKADMTTWLKLTLSPGERELAEAMERNLDKYGFDVGLRAVYVTTEGIRPLVKVGVGNSVKQFGSPGMNGFKFSFSSGYLNPWEDYHGIRTRLKKRKIFRFYRLRSYFYPPAHKHPMVMTTEELSTIFHFPGQVATTPSLDRIPSKRGEPPVNLPI